MKLSKKDNKNDYEIGLLALSLLIITIISTILLSIPITHAETVSSDASISVGMSCSMAVTPGTGGAASSDGYTYQANVTPGNYTEIDGSILTTTCNGPGNYSLYAIGYSGDSYDTPTNTQMISSTGSNNIVTGTATSGSTSNWAFKLASVAGASTPTIISPYNNYTSIPGADFAKVATMLGTTGLSSTSKVQAKYQVYASSTQIAGTYTGKVKYTMVYPNDASAPSTVITFDQAFANAGKTKQGNYYKMQDGDGSICAEVTTGQTGSLIDTRGGGTVYTVAKIGDLCWMTTNLDLAGGTALSADDTDVTSYYISSFTSSNNLTKDGNAIILPPSTTTSGFDTDNYSYVANSGNASSDCSNASGCYSYYSWDAATLGSGRSLSTDSTDAEQSICPRGWHLPNTRSGIDDTSDFRKLIITLGGSKTTQAYNNNTSPTGATMSNNLSSNPNNFLFAGQYIDGLFENGGSRGYFWTSTSYSNGDIARQLNFNSNNVYSSSSSNRCFGYSVRCVLGI